MRVNCPVWFDFGGSPPRGAPHRKKAKKVDCLAAKAETLNSEFTEIKDLLLNLQPGRGASTWVDSPQARTPTPLEWDEDALSMRASCSQFCEERLMLTFTFTPGE